MHMTNGRPARRSVPRSSDHEPGKIGLNVHLKGELYGGNDRAKRDLAGDAAALANTAGGVLLLGVAEDDRQLRYPASR